MKILEEIEEIIRKRKAIDDLYIRIANSKIPVERSVIVEKYKEPVSSIAKIYTNDEHNDDYIDDEYFRFITRISNYTNSYLSWYNSEDKLHSFNGNPSRITWNSKSIEIEWHKNGEPFRESLKYNKIIITNKKETYSVNLGHVLTDVNIILYQMFNKKQQLHSFNNMPAVISESSICWYWNGKKCRNASYICELPSSINRYGDLTFQTINEDCPQNVKFPLSKKYYSESVLGDLRNYEKYVEWPIRQMFTL